MHDGGGNIYEIGRKVSSKQSNLCLAAVAYKLHRRGRCRLLQLQSLFEIRGPCHRPKTPAMTRL